MVGIGRACLFGDFLSGARRWLGGIGDWGLVLWDFSFLFLGMLRKVFLQDGMGFVMSL